MNLELLTMCKSISQSFRPFFSYLLLLVLFAGNVHYMHAQSPEILTTPGADSLLNRTNQEAVMHSELISQKIPGIHSQSINLQAGWSMFSTYIVPLNSSILSLFLPILPQLIVVKNAEGEIYWPEYSVNQLTTFFNTRGYQIMTNNSVVFTITGQVINPASYPINIEQGWSIIPYLKMTALPIETMLESIENHILLIKDDQGLLYIPGYNINQINYMVPGEAYQIKTNSSCILQYPNN